MKRTGIKAGIQGKGSFPGPLSVLLLAALQLLAPARLTAQEHYFKHYEVTDGLSHNTIHCATQDDRGFMWFGTKNGLNRFDGYRFDWFQSDEDKPGSIGSNFIECLTFADGFLWIGTDNGLFTGNPETAEFELLAPTTGQPILDVAHGANQTLWYIAENSLYSLNQRDGTVKKRTLSPPGEPARKIVATDGLIAVATVSRVFLYQPDHDAFLPLELNLPLNNNFPLSIASLYFLDDSSLAIGTVSHGAFLYDLPTRSARAVLNNAENRLYVRDFLLRGTDLWIGTEDGIYVHNLDTGKNTHLEKDISRPYALSDNAIYCLFEDRRRGVWIGTYFRGLNYYSESLAGFQKFIPVNGSNSVSGSAIRELAEDRYGGLWIGTEDAGLNRYDPETGQFGHYPLVTFNEGITATNIHGLLVRGDELWVGTFQNGLFVLDVKTGKVKRHEVAGETSGLRSNFIYTLYQTADSSLYAMTSSGVHRYREAEDKFTVVSFFPVDYFYTSFLEDSDGGLWAGTYWDGLFYYHPERNISRAYGKESGGEFMLSNDAINGIFEDSRKNIWVTTENGLNRLLPETREIVRYGKKDGFSSNVFYSMAEDENGKIWLSTANGLICFHPDPGRIDKYTTENGLLSNQFNYNSSFRDDKGRMYFGGVKGFVSFAPSDPRFNKQGTPETLVLTGLNISGPNQSGKPDDSHIRGLAAGTDLIELSHDQSTFNISYSALDYNTPGLTEYSYQLEGLKDDWVSTGNANVIYFTALAPGSYTLRVKARSNNSDWSKPFQLLRLKIRPPLWKSSLAYLLYAALISVVVFFSLRFYHRYNQDKNLQQLQLFNNEKEKEIYKAKIEFFTNVSHEILTPLTLIKNPVEKLLEDAPRDSPLKDNLGIVHRNTMRLVNLVQQLLDFRKTEMDHATLSFVSADITRLLKDTAERFRSAAEEKGITITLALGTVPVYAFVDAEAVRKILSNLFQNAIKYGESQVAVLLTVTGTEVSVSVRNDGILIPASEKERIFKPFHRLAAHQNHQGTGIGLSLAHSLAELHKGSLKVDVSDRVMNHFVLILPLFQEENFVLEPSVVVPESGEKPASKPPVLPQAARATILLVEDNLDLLDFVAADLREEYPVLKATSGEEALELLQTQSIQLIISDVMMPGMDGFELCRRIKTDLKVSHVPIILLTSRSSLNAEISGLEAGADAYVTKPFSMPYLKTRVSNLLENRRHIISHFSSTPLAHIQSIAHSPVDESFLRELDDIIHDHIADADLNVEDLANRLHMSRSTLYRKIKDLSGFSPNELINLARLKKAAELLKTRKYKIYEIAGMVGYNSATSFGRNFQKQFGKSPSDYLATETAFAPDDQQPDPA